MKKRFLLVNLLSLFSLALVGCKRNLPVESGVDINELDIKPEEVTGELDIGLYLAGFGREFLDAMITRYKQIYPNVKVNPVEYFVGDAQVIDAIKAGPEDNPIDLFVAGPVYASDLIEQGNAIIKSYDPILEDLSDVYRSKPYGEDITIEQKTYTSVANSLKYNSNLSYFPQYEKYVGKVYSLPWAYGPGGLIFNKDFFDAHPEYKIPKTSNQLITLIQTIYDNHVVGKSDAEKVYPVIWAGANAAAYWRYMTSTWIAQYDGLDSWDRFLRTVDTNNQFSDTVFKTEGMLKALEALAPIIDFNKSYPNSIGTNHVDAQVQFMRGKAAMLPSGDWTERETKDSDSFGENGPDDIMMIRTPVLSAVGQKLGITDEQLGNIVDAIDRGESSLGGIDQAIFDKVKETRFISTNCDFNHNIVIPAYSNAKIAAKFFINFMFSTEGQKIFLEKAGGFMPYKLELSEEELSKLSPFTQSTYELGKTSTMIAMDYTKSPIMYRNNLQLFNMNGGVLEVQMAKKTPISASEALDKAYEFVHNRWNQYLRVAGITQ